MAKHPKVPPKKKAAKAAPGKTAVKKKAVKKKTVVKKRTTVAKRTAVKKKRSAISRRAPARTTKKTVTEKTVNRKKRTTAQPKTIRLNPNIEPAGTLSPPEEQSGTPDTITAGVPGMDKKSIEQEAARHYDNHHIRLSNAKKGIKPSGKKPLW